jgi:putative ABC transport system permease protein
MSITNRLREWRNARAEHRAVADEMQFHIDRETQHNIDQGMSAQEARRKAKQDFGSIDSVTEAARDERTGTRLSDFKASWLDWKLGARMLIKYPGISVIGGLTLAATMALGAGWFEFSWEMSDPDLPLPDGDRIVRLENFDAADNGVDPRAMYDFIAWRDQLKSIEDFGAYRNIERNLITADGRALPEKVAEITASGFAVPRVAPLHGRMLTDADAEPGAPDVVVIGYDLWHRRFNADPGVIGRTVQLGRVKATVVGVMPDAFLWPRSHQLWAPLRVAQTLPRSGPAINMFGRLADDVSLETAQAELDAIGERMAAANPATHAQLRPRVLAYAAPGNMPPVFMINLLAWGVLLVAGTNVATLMFARTALRESEIVVRNALGASRMRVMGQLFTESLVLSLVSAVVGLVAFTLFASWASSDAMSDVDEPFWWDLTLGPETILYVCALAVFGAVVVGLLPALRATGPKVQAALRNIGGGGTHMQVGGLWTGLIVFQVALSVLGLPLAIAATRETLSQIQVRSEFDATPYLTFRAALNVDETPEGAADTTGAVLAARMATVLDALERRLETEPNVAAVTYSASVPGSYHPLARIEVQRGSEAPVRIVNTQDKDDDQVFMSAVDIDFFDAFRMDVISGRAFNSSDVGAANGVVVINEALAKNIGGNPVGARVRVVSTEGEQERSPWLEVVGVVSDLGLDPTATGEADFMFTPAAVGALDWPRGAVRLNGDAAAYEAKLRTIAAQVAPELRLYDVLALDEVLRKDNENGLFAMTVAIGVNVLILMLSAAGLFALMSVAVIRRTREIGIRLAIGANPRAVLAALFKRAATQVGVGIIIGNILVVVVLFKLFEEMNATTAALPMAIASLIMATVGFCACFLPARRALRVQPTEALRSAR